MAVQNYLDVSTQHVKQTTLNPRPARQHLVASYGEGAFYYVPEEFDKDCPADLAQVLKYAKLEGCDLVRLDCDGDIIEDLPKYDW